MAALQTGRLHYKIGKNRELTRSYHKIMKTQCRISYYDISGAAASSRDYLRYQRHADTGTSQGRAPQSLEQITAQYLRALTLSETGFIFYFLLCIRAMAVVVGQ